MLVQSVRVSVGSKLGVSAHRVKLLTEGSEADSFSVESSLLFQTLSL